jgi:hypothetical protein
MVSIAIEDVIHNGPHISRERERERVCVCVCSTIHGSIVNEGREEAYHDSVSKPSHFFHRTQTIPAISYLPTNILKRLDNF